MRTDPSSAVPTPAAATRGVPNRPARRRPATLVAWWLVTLSSLAIVVVASRYLSADPDVFFPQQRAIYLANTVALIAHVAGGMVALALGPFQFVPAIRRRWPRAHRIVGKTYLLGVAVGGLAGLWMARLAFGGPVAQAGFGALGLLWLTTSAMALVRIRAGDVRGHRSWMVRSFALTFAAVTLRLYLPVPMMLGVDFATAYAAIAWACWVPNLLGAEAILRFRAARSRYEAVQTV